MLSIANSIFGNHERARLDIKKQAEGISKKYNYFDDDDDDDDDDDKPFPDFVSIKQESDIEIDNASTIPYASLKRESDNEIDNASTILYTSPKRESDNEIDKKSIKSLSYKLRLKLKNKLSSTKIGL